MGGWCPHVHGPLPPGPTSQVSRDVPGQEPPWRKSEERRRTLGALLGNLAAGRSVIGLRSEGGKKGMLVGGVEG